MEKSVTLEIPESEAFSLEAALDDALLALRGLDDGFDAREEHMTRLRAETHVLMEQIRAELHVEKTV